MRGLNKFILFFFVCFISCGEEKKDTEVTTDSEIRHKYYSLEQSGWKSKTYTQTVDEIDFKATEVPLPFYILKELGNEDLFTIDSIDNANSKERIIEFEFSHKQAEDLLKEEFTQLNYEESIKYMAFKIEKDFYAVTSNKDTIPCSGVIFERNYKVAPYHKILLFFTDIPPKDPIQLVYEDKLFQKGTMKFKFNETITKLIL